VKVKAIGQHEFFKSALGAAVAVLCGLMLWQMPLGEPWVNASYDDLFRFGAHAVTNRVTLILMDNEAYDYFHQNRLGTAVQSGLVSEVFPAGIVLDCIFLAMSAPRNVPSVLQIHALDFLFRRPVFETSEFTSQKNIPTPTAHRILKLCGIRGFSKSCGNPAVAGLAFWLFANS
jgi:hypothetical protein